MSTTAEPGHDPVTTSFDGYVLVPHERPEDWGWHQEFKVLPRVMGWFAVIALVLMVLFGNHTGNVENLWVLAIAALIAAILVRNTVRRRSAWRN